MSNFHVGQKVVCIAANAADTIPLNAVITISAVWLYENEPYLDCVEYPCPKEKMYTDGYLACCFRPVAESEQFRKLVADIPLERRRELLDG